MNATEFGLQILPSIKGYASGSGGPKIVAVYSPTEDPDRDPERVRNMTLLLGQIPSESEFMVTKAGIGIVEAKNGRNIVVVADLGIIEHEIYAPESITYWYEGASESDLSRITFPSQAIIFDGNASGETVSLDSQSLSKRHTKISLLECLRALMRENEKDVNWAVRS